MPKQLRGESPSCWEQLLGMCVFSPFSWSPDQSESTCAPLCVCVSGACATAGFRRSQATRAVVRPLLAASLLLAHPGGPVAALGQGRAGLLPRRGHRSGLASDTWTLSCLRSGWRAGQQTLLP